MSGLGAAAMGAPVVGEQPYNQELSDKKSQAYSALWDLEEQRDASMDALEFWTDADEHTDSPLLLNTFSSEVEGHLKTLDSVDDQIKAVEATIKTLEKGQPVAGGVPPTGMHCS